MAYPADLVIIGHVGFATERTASGYVASYPGGSGFASAFAAAALFDRAGLVAQVGEDFDLGVLQALGIGMEGIAVLPGASARFRIEPSGDGGLSFDSDLGVAAEPNFGTFPASYRHARFVHLGSAPPRQQLAWLEFLRASGCQAQVSVDMFEPFVAADPQACREACARADFVFLTAAGVDLRGRRGYPVGDRVRGRWLAGNQRTRSHPGGTGIRAGGRVPSFRPVRDGTRRVSC